MTSPWILLVEDDPIFTLLFSRAWKTARPNVPIVTADSLEAMRKVLAAAGTAPHILVVDENLPDGNGHQECRESSVPSYCWSAMGEGGVRSKPRGQQALVAAVQDIATVAGLEPSTEPKQS